MRVGHATECECNALEFLFGSMFAMAAPIKIRLFDL
jgi:hypothetical protein